MLRRRGVEVHLAVDSHQQLQQQLLKARGHYHLRWLWCQAQLLWPIVKALVAYKIWSDWALIPGEAYTVLKSRANRAELLRCCPCFQRIPEGGEQGLVGDQTTVVTKGSLHCLKGNDFCLTV